MSPSSSMLSGMDNVIKTLHIACALSESSSMPGLDVLAKGALKLAEMVKETRDVQDQCSLLAERTAKLSAAVYCQLSTGISTLDESTATRHIESLLETLQAVEGIMRRRKKARFIRTFWHRGTIANEVKTLNDQLEDSFRAFDIQSSIHTNQQISMLLQCSEHLLRHAENSERVETALLSGSRRIDSNVQEILHRVRVDATHDGTMRLYARDEVELVEEIGTEGTEVEPGEEPVVQFRARLCQTGRNVTVRRFAQPGRRFRDAVATAKKIWHPNVVHAIGYSREDPDTAFIVNGGVYTHTYDDVSKTFHGVDKFLWTMQSSKQVVAGLIHLKSVYGEIEWAADEDTYSMGVNRDLVVGADGRVLLDVGCYHLKRLPNTIIHDDGMVELHSRARGLVRAFSNPLEGTCDQRFAALCDLWHKLVSFADFSRDDSLFWRTLPIPCPGQCLSLANRWIVDGLEYEELVHGARALDPEYREPTLHLHPRVVQERVEREGMLDVSDRPGVQHEVATQQMEAFGEDGEARSVDQKWRRYAVRDMAYGWTLETLTAVRETSDCRGWFMNRAVDFSHIGEDLGDLIIAYALKFRTRTCLIQPPSRKSSHGEAVPPPALFFYERVHTRAQASLDETLDWPWGFWSTEAHDEIEPLEMDDTDGMRARKQHIKFQGVSPDGEFVWAQRVGRCAFQIKVRVEVQYYRFTPDECMVLHEMQRWATPEDRANAGFEMIEDDDEDGDDGDGEVSDSDDNGDAMDWE